MKKIITAVWLGMALVCAVLTAGFATDIPKVPQAHPDTIGNASGYRIATQADDTYWDNVNVGDLLIFGTPYTIQPSGIQTRRIYTNYTPTITLAAGKKIHLWRGNYVHIEIFYRVDAQGPEGIQVTGTSDSNPMVITNLGGQVQFGNYGKVNNEHAGSFVVHGINHVRITGEYDPMAKTGHTDFRGLNGDLTTEGWYKRFGILGDHKWASFANATSQSLGVSCRSFLYAQILGVSAMHGFFTGFSVKSDNNSLGENTKIDVQRCFSGWQEAEGFYLGSTDDTADNVPYNQIICKNNVVLFVGAEGIQVDKMSNGSEVKNNFIYKTGCFYQVPFQASHYHEHGLQTSFVQGGVTTENNIIYSGNAGHITNGGGVVQRGNVTVSASTITYKNNLFGPSRRSYGFIKESPGDPSGLVNFYYYKNVIDSITVPQTNDAYFDSDNDLIEAHMQINDTTGPFYITRNIYPAGNTLYVRVNKKSKNPIVTTNSVAKKAPRLRLHESFGFDPKDILSFRGVWLTGGYAVVPKTGPISYNKGDVVFMVTLQKTRYYRCKLAHSAPKNPSTETTYWEKLTWSGKDEPVYTPLLKPDTYYNYRGMGLTSNPANSNSFDSIPPVVTTATEVFARVNDTFSFPGFTATDNRDGNITSHVKYYWKNGNAPQVNSSNKLIAHGQYELVLNVEDEAGNRTEPVTIKVLVSDQSVFLANRGRLNFHTFSKANLTTSPNYWTDIAEDAAGLKSATGQDPFESTYSNMRDTAGVLLSWHVRIDDGNTSSYPSRFFGTWDNAGSQYAIGDFPAIINKEGLRMRQGVETTANINFLDLDPNLYYDFRFTGLKVGPGEVKVSLKDSISGQEVIFNVINNTQVFELTNLKPTAGGRITLIHAFVSATGQSAAGESALSGFIITEKDGFGIINNLEDTDPTDADITQFHISYTSPGATTSGNHWNNFVVANSNITYTLTNLVAKDGSSTVGTITVVRSDTEGFNYNNGGDTGLTTTNNSGPVPDIVLQHWAGVNARPANIIISGLSSSDRYTIQTLSNGRSVWAGNNRFTAVTVQGSTQTQNFTPTGGNLSNFLTWTDVAPDANGEIEISVANSGQIYGGINAVIMTLTSGSSARMASKYVEAAPQAAAETTDGPVSVYPVPAKGGVLTIVSNDPSDRISAVRIFDTSGRQHSVKVISQDDRNIELDVTSLNGLYWLQIDTQSQKRLSRKVIIRK